MIIKMNARGEGNGTRGARDQLPTGCLTWGSNYQLEKPARPICVQVISYDDHRINRRDGVR